MALPDLNLLVVLDALLAEGSVAGAARRLRMSPSAMSRALGRVRQATGDPLLVRAGRGLVPTPRAAELRERVRQIIEEAGAVLRANDRIDLGTLVRTFTLRTSDGFVETFGPGLLSLVEEEAPRVRLFFLQKPDKESAPLRDGRVDLETGIIEAATGPEMRSQVLFRDRLVGVVHEGHPLSRGDVTAAAWSQASHVIVSRSGLEEGAVDRPFLSPGTKRGVGTLVSGFSAALSLVRASDLVATVPDRHTRSLRDGLFSFPLPVPSEAFAVSMLWHPRMDSDPAHRWLRGCLRRACA
jgi:DNA-binding transcriptional LysR family regulator